MSDALELALVLLACTTPVLAIMGLNHYLKQLKQRDKRAAEYMAGNAQEIAELRQRIEVLEAVITDKSYHLEQELRSLGRQGRG